MLGRRRWWWWLLPLGLAGPTARAQQQQVSFAECDAADKRQLWCLTDKGEIMDHWGRCLSRDGCDDPGGVGKLLVTTCGTQCTGSQNWEWDSDSNRIAAKIHGGDCQWSFEEGGWCVCLSINVLGNNGETFSCKKHVPAHGDGYCSDANDRWTFRRDGTLSVKNGPKALCKALQDFKWDDCADPTGPLFNYPSSCR